MPGDEPAVCLRRHDRKESEGRSHANGPVVIFLPSARQTSAAPCSRSSLPAMMQCDVSLTFEKNKILLKYCLQGILKRDKSLGFRIRHRHLGIGEWPGSRRHGDYTSRSWAWQVTWFKFAGSGGFKLMSRLILQRLASCPGRLARRPGRWL